MLLGELSYISFLDAELNHCTSSGEVTEPSKGRGKQKQVGEVDAGRLKEALCRPHTALASAVRT